MQTQPLSFNLYTLQEQERLAYISGGFDADLYDFAIKGQAVEDLQIHGYEIHAGFPQEDCLRDLIEHAQALARGRVTKDDVAKFAEMLEDRQSEISRAAEYGRDQVANLQADIAEALF
jgi:hypothetical protein